MAVQKNVPIMFLMSDMTIIHGQLRTVTVVQTTMSEENARDTLLACGLPCDILLVVDPNEIEPKEEQDG